jgi:hypothetical protein
MTREQIEAIRARLSGVFGPHGDGLAAAPSLAADVSALLEEVERLTRENERLPALSALLARGPCSP